MNDCQFIQERENEMQSMSNVLTGWETVVFQVEDEPEEEQWAEPLRLTI